MKKLISLLAFVIIVTTSFAQIVPSTQSILSAAYKKAAKENKNVFVIFHASWCGWCKKLDASLNDASIKKYFDSNYVFVHLTVAEVGENRKLENAGADEFLTKYKGQTAGLPFFLVIDKNKKLLGNSFMNNANIGCPANKKEVEYFASLLKKSSTINTEGLAKIIIRFRKNEQ
jgi:thioredoxin-related protein